MHNIQKTAIYATCEDGVLNITGRLGVLVWLGVLVVANAIHGK